MQSQHHKNWNGRIWGGLFLLVIGGLLFLDKFGFPFPGWLFSWPILLIVIGLFVGIRHGFQGSGWAMMILVGSIALFVHNAAWFSIRKFWPLIIVLIGLMMIFRPRGNSRWRDHFRDRGRPRPGDGWNENYQSGPQSFSEVENVTSADRSSEDYIDSVAFFGSTRRVILSKDFKGGDLVSVFGGNEIDLTKADIRERAELEITVIMGGMKLILPSDWNIKSELVAVFGGIEDKRTFLTGVTDSKKILVLKGTTIFGGITIRNY